jgi:hypothetical protein
MKDHRVGSILDIVMLLTYDFHAQNIVASLNDISS